MIVPDNEFVDAIIKVKRFITQYTEVLSFKQEKQLIVGLQVNSDYEFLKQVYSYLNIIHENENEYLAYFNYLKENFNLGSDIVEIGAGEFPVLAHYIDTYQRKIGKGTITIYDPCTIVKKLGNIIIKKEEFTKDCKLNKVDLLVGYHPCEATTAIIDYRNESKHVPFSLVKCPCNHMPDSEKDKYIHIPDPSKWSAFIKDYLQTHTNEKALIYYDKFFCGDRKRTVINKTYQYKLVSVTQKTQM